MKPFERMKGTTNSTNFTNEMEQRMKGTTNFTNENEQRTIV